MENNRPRRTLWAEVIKISQAAGRVKHVRNGYKIRQIKSVDQAFNGHLKWIVISSLASRGMSQ